MKQKIKKASGFVVQSLWKSMGKMWIKFLNKCY